MGKRTFDIVVSIFGIAVLILPMFFFWLLSSWDTKSNGLFCQVRIGQFGKTFVIYKLRTWSPDTDEISAFGKFLRKHKIDEFPQLFNVLKGDMSLVGPRPDVPGYYDLLEGEDRKLLGIKPGLTCEASIKYRNEDEILMNRQNPLEYNDKVIFPDKVRMNLEYFENRSFKGDFKILWKTFFG